MCSSRRIHTVLQPLYLSLMCRTAEIGWFGKFENQNKFVLYPHFCKYVKHLTLSVYKESHIGHYDTLETLQKMKNLEELTVSVGCDKENYLRALQGNRFKKISLRLSQHSPSSKLVKTFTPETLVSLSIGMYWFYF